LGGVIAGFFEIERDAGQRRIAEIAEGLFIVDAENGGFIGDGHTRFAGDIAEMTGQCVAACNDGDRFGQLV
jgi:hypothetical protein